MELEDRGEIIPITLRQGWYDEAISRGASPALALLAARTMELTYEAGVEEARAKGKPAPEPPTVVQVEPLLLLIVDAAKRLSVSETTMKTMIERGDVLAFKLPGFDSVRVPRPELDAYVDELTRKEKLKRKHRPSRHR